MSMMVSMQSYDLVTLQVVLRLIHALLTAWSVRWFKGIRFQQSLVFPTTLYHQYFNYIFINTTHSTLLISIT
jgi:hypothetical protein